MSDEPVGLLFFGGTHAFVFVLMVTLALAIVIVATGAWLYVAIRSVMCRPFGKGSLGTILTLSVLLPWLGGVIYAAFMVQGLGRRRVVDRKDDSPSSDYAPALQPTSLIPRQLVVRLSVGLFLCAGLAYGQVDYTGKRAGDLVLDFGDSGVVTSNPSNGMDWARTIAVDSAFMYVTGSNEAPGEGDTQWWVEKRKLSDGSPDPAFGRGGSVISNPSSGNDYGFHAAVGDGAIYVVGTQANEGGADWRIEKRRLADGSLDPTFGKGGVAVSDPSTPGYNSPACVAVDSSFLYIVGDAGTAEDTHWRIEKRACQDGSFVTEFGEDGVVTSNPSKWEDWANDLVIDTRSMYVSGGAGVDQRWDKQWRIEKRGLVSGTPIAAFGESGTISINPSTNDNEKIQESPEAIAIDSSSLYVLGIDLGKGGTDWQWRIEKRDQKDGSADREFGTLGTLRVNPTPRADFAWDLAVASGVLYVTGYEALDTEADRQWRIESRASGNGALTKGFGNAGVVRSNPGPHWDMPRAIDVDSSFIYIVGNDERTETRDRQRRIEKRYRFSQM